eukprot:scpid87891/ scgid10850/ 
MSLQFGTDGAASAAPSPPPGRTECLLIGAAEEPDNDSLGVDETLKRLHNSVKSDLGKMIEFCAEWAKDEPPKKMAKKASRTPSLSVHSKSQPSLDHPIVITSIFVSSDTLVPKSDDTGFQLSPKAKTFMQSCPPKVHVFKTKKELRDAVKNFTKLSSCENLIIFYAGHGAQHEIKAGKVVDKEPCKKGSQEGAASKLMEVREKSVKEIQHSLYLPLPSFPYVEYYDLYADHELTYDVTAHLEPSQNMYLVLHACNSGGMFHGWQLRADQRLRGPETSLSVAVFASSEAENVSDWTSLGGDADFVSIFTEFAKPGKKLIEIQSDIFKASVQRNRDRKPGVSPALIVLRPDQRDELFLPK